MSFGVLSSDGAEASRLDVQNHVREVGNLVVRRTFARHVWGLDRIRETTICGIFHNECRGGYSHYGLFFHSASSRHRMG